MLCAFYLLSITLSPSLMANTSTQLQKQRALFLKAKIALETNKPAEYKKLHQQLNDYPLTVYLDYLYLRQRLGIVSEQEISRFLAENPNTFFADRLRKRWLTKLAAQKKWTTFLQHYQLPQSAKIQCLRLQALMNTNQEDAAFADTPALWLTPKSQDKACDPIFKKWKQKGFLTENLLHQRIQLALAANQFSLATFLAKSLPDTAKQQQWIARWKKIHQQPISLLKQLPVTNKPASTTVSLAHDIDISRQVIKHGLQRLARKSPSKAQQHWQRIEPHYQFRAQDKIDIQRYIGQRAALNRDDKALQLFGDVINEPWKIRAALWQQDWRAVKHEILNLSSEEQHKTRWQYWLARSLESLGDKQLATETYQSIIHERDYYSFLAADRIKQPYKMNHKPIQIDPQTMEQFKNRPAVQRLHEFFLLDMQLQARRQLYRLTQTLPKNELMMLATLTHEWQWHNQTIAVLGKARYWDALNLRFPILFESDMEKASKTTGIDTSWLLAIARQESAFNPQARSHVGARGLMQIMPKTGKLIAKLINKPLKHTKELFKPQRNIQLGSAYLKHVYEQQQQNLVLATASYNAGPHRVKRWLPEQKLPADIWIENIPFNETRHYTSNVLAYSAIFDYQRQQPINRLSLYMADVKPKPTKP